MCAGFLSRWSAKTYRNKTIKVMCFWLSEQPVFLLVAKETDNTLTWDLASPGVFGPPVLQMRHIHLIIICTQFDKWRLKNVTCGEKYHNAGTMCEWWLFISPQTKHTARIWGKEMVVSGLFGVGHVRTCSLCSPTAPCAPHVITSIRRDTANTWFVCFKPKKLIYFWGMEHQSKTF